jgi:hypothetical protein
MRDIKRWMMALIALAGFNGALPQAQAQVGLSNSNRSDSLDIASVDLTAHTYTDGATIP